jgi:HK97 family phage major capsid protein
VSEKVKELRAQLDEARSRVKEIDSEHAGKYLDPESSDGQEWNRLNEEIDDLAQTLSQCEAREARVAELAGRSDNRESGTSFNTARPGAVRGDDIWDLESVRMDFANPEAAGREFRERGKRAIERATPAHADADKAGVQGHLERLQNKLDGDHGAFSRHMLVTGSPRYQRAFLKGIAGQGMGTEEQRALNLTGETGGYLLPYTLDPTIIPTSNGVVNPLRSISRVEQTTTDVWKGVTSGGMVAKFREAEGEETTDDSPKFGQPEIQTHAADAFAQWTYEFGQDYGAIAPELATLVQDAKDELEATKLLSGSGEKEPFGLATGATELIETITKEAFAAGDLYALEQALPPRFRSRAAWVANRAIYNLTRQFDTGGGASFWVNLKEGLANTPNGNMNQRLLDYPTNELSTMESKLTKLKTVLYFGDFRYFVIADRIGMIAKPIDNIPGENGRPTGQSGLYFFWRVGSKVMSKAAFRGLKVKE